MFGTLFVDTLDLDGGDGHVVVGEYAVGVGRDGISDLRF